MTKTKRPQFGGLAPQYTFMLNPYPDLRVSRCPICEKKTGQRKIPLLIHVDPMYLIALNYTCRYCKICDLLVADKHSIEHMLTEMFYETDACAVGNEYFCIGTLEKSAWREGLHQPKVFAELRPHASDFVKNYKETRMSRPGWYPPGQEPPLLEPPVSQEWVKTSSDRPSRSAAKKQNAEELENGK
jgi:hypothetical protein